MDYGKRQRKKTLEQIKHPELKNRETKNKPKRSNWEIRQEQSKKKRQAEKHKEYINRKTLKLKEHQEPSNFKNVDNKIYKTASKQNGTISISQIYQLLIKNYFNNYSLDKFPINKYIYQWLKFQNNKESNYFIKDYDTNIPKHSVTSFPHLYGTGFLDSKDIKHDLSLNSIKQADRILKPTATFTSMILSKKDTNHIPAQKLFKVSHLVQTVTRNGKRIKRTYGMNKPTTVVSVADYYEFLRINYKSNHLTNKYAKSRLNKFGRKLFKVCKELTPQQKTRALMNYVIKDIYNQSVKTLGSDDILLDPLLKLIIWKIIPQSTKSKLLRQQSHILSKPQFTKELKDTNTNSFKLSYNNSLKRMPTTYKTLVNNSKKVIKNLNHLRKNH